MEKLQTAIEKTREYGRRFGVEYGAFEIKERLISGKVFEEKEVDEKLKNVKHHTQMGTSNLKLKTRDKKIKKVKKLARLIGKYFKNILLITVTGSVAAGYPKRDDDIDLMIVTRNQSLWITRLALRIMIKLLQIPHRKYGKKEKGDEFCFNLWLEGGSMTIPNSKQDLKNAMDSVLMVPILNRENTLEKFFEDNNWIGKFMATSYKSKKKKEKSKILKEVSIILKAINWLVFWPQYFYMKRRIVCEVVRYNMAFFHP